MIKVLLADDQPLMRGGFKALIEAEDDMTVVAEAADGRSACDQARQLRPDVVLADIRMPGRDGLEVTRLLAGPGTTDPLRVIVVTTFDLDEYVHTALREGACGFILKRSGPNLLIEAIRAAMAGEALISPQVTVRLLRRMVPPKPSTPSGADLTARELEVVRLVAEGRTNAEIAQTLVLSPGTIKNHIAAAQRKLQSRNRVGIAAWAWSTGQMSPGDPT